MKSEKEIAKWLEEEVDFLTRNDDYCGGWLKLDDTYAAVVLWEEGWGDEKRDDVIQSESDPDYGLCAGVKIFNPSDTVDGWLYPSNAETGDLLCESCGIEPSENYKELAKWIMDCYDVVKDFKPAKDGTIVVEVEESLKEDVDDEEIGVKSGTLPPEEPVKPNNKDDAKATDNQRLAKNIAPNNKENAKESLSESLNEIELKTYDDVEKIKSKCSDCRWEILLPSREEGKDGRYWFNKYKELGARLFVIEKDGEMFFKQCFPNNSCRIVDWRDMPVKNLKESKQFSNEIELKTYDDVKKIKSRCIGCRWEILASPKEHGSDGRYYFDRYKELGTRLFVIEKDGEMFLKKCHKDGECEIVDWRDMHVEDSMQESLKEDKKEIKPFTAGWLKDLLKDIDDEAELALQPIEIDGVSYELSDLSVDYNKDEEDAVVNLSVSVSMPEEGEEEIKFSDEDSDEDEVELVAIDSDEDDDVGEIYDFSDFEDEEPVILD